MTSLIPRMAKLWLLERIRWIVSTAIHPVSTLKYMPYEYGADAYLIPKHPQPGYETCDSGLAIPPRDLWVGSGLTKEDYLSSGQTQVSRMLDLTKESGFSFCEGHRILDFGCAAGRMIRHLRHLSDICEIWGTDISASHIVWAKQHLSPPFHFAVTTTVPHLPFEDRSFHFIYCISVFTHIDDLTETWLSELRRILAPEGRLYMTIHDGHTMELLDGPYSHTWLAKSMKMHDVYNSSKSTMGKLVIGRDTTSQVFYDVDYFCRTLNSMGFDVLSLAPPALYYQTQILVKRK